METIDQPSDWLTWEQLSARLAARGVDDISERQLERWRNEGVFPAVRNIPTKFHGSVTYYPPNSCEQALEIRRLLGEKDLFAYVGWELWWRGFRVSEIHWKPALERAASQWDRYLGKLRLQIDKDEKSDSGKTIYDRAAQSNLSDIILSRVSRRVEFENLAIVLRVLLSTAQGEFDGFESVTKTRENQTDRDGYERPQRPRDQAQTILALDFGPSENNAIFSKKFNFSGALLPILQDLSKALRNGKMADVIQYPEAEIENTRDDLRNAMRLATALYEAKAWIYGSNAFGLRLMAWVSKKATQGMKCSFILCWAKLRQVSTDLYPSHQIASLADEADALRSGSLKLRELAKNDKRFSSVLTPRRIRTALKDKISFRQFIKEIQAARVR